MISKRTAAYSLFILIAGPLVVAFILGLFAGMADTLASDPCSSDTSSVDTLTAEGLR